MSEGGGAGRWGVFGEVHVVTDGASAEGEYGGATHLGGLCACVCVHM